MFIETIKIAYGNEDVKKKFVNTTGVIMLNMIEGKSLWDMAKELKIDAWQVDNDIDMMLYTIRRNVGWKRYIKALFKK